MLKQRKRYCDREDITFEEKQQILQKTNGKCAKCGRALKIGDNFTKDHYIPLDKGGTNEMVNLIPLCYDCNQQKSNAVMKPKHFYKYVDDTYMEELQTLYHNYITEIKWLSRTNLCRVDQFRVMVPKQTNQIRSCKTKQGWSHEALHMWIPAILKKCVKDEVDILVDFLQKYFKKINYEEDVEETKSLVIRYLNEGCIYKLVSGSEIVALLPIVFDDFYMDLLNYDIKTHFKTLTICNIPILYQKEHYLFSILEECLAIILDDLQSLNSEWKQTYRIITFKEDTWLTSNIESHKTCYVLESDDSTCFIMCKDVMDTVPKNDTDALIKALEKDSLELEKIFKSVIKDEEKQEKKAQKKKQLEKQRRRIQREERDYEDLKRYLYVNTF